jgi:membrane-bound lytic murein transglycosylase B
VPRKLLPGLLLCAALNGGASAAPLPFDQCLAGLQDRARQAGVAQWLVDEVIPEMEQQQRVIELDRKQPEFVKTFGQYLSARVTETRVQRGRALYQEHRSFLDGLARRYGVPGRYLVAFWGLETNFGSYMGSMPTLDSLATLACDTRRGAFFTDEFITALKVVQREQLAPDKLQGSWAGAMGHTQFMPSTYERYAVDGDGDGRVDLWDSPQDALASGANFLRALGWRPGARWGREVRLPADFAYADSGLKHRLPITDWARRGLTTADRQPLPTADFAGSVLVPAGASGPAFLIYDNFRVIMGWNRSEFYALSVGHLADRIGGAGKLRRTPPEDQKALSREDVIALQNRLLALGYNPGAADGIFGADTRRALSAFQQDAGLTADGFPDSLTLRRLAEKRSE